MSGERKVHDEQADYFGPVAIAQFIDIGWIHDWPMCWTRVGRKAIGNGYGIWQGTHQQLPYDCAPSPAGAVYWRGRRADNPCDDRRPKSRHERAMMHPTPARSAGRPPRS